MIPDVLLPVSAIAELRDDSRERERDQAAKDKRARDRRALDQVLNPQRARAATPGAQAIREALRHVSLPGEKVKPSGAPVVKEAEPDAVSEFERGRLEAAALEPEVAPVVQKLPAVDTDEAPEPRDAPVHEMPEEVAQVLKRLDDLAALARAREHVPPQGMTRDMLDDRIEGALGFLEGYCGLDDGQGAQEMDAAQARLAALVSQLRDRLDVLRGARLPVDMQMPEQSQQPAETGQPVDAALREAREAAELADEGGDGVTQAEQGGAVHGAAPAASGTAAVPGTGLLPAANAIDPRPAVSPKPEQAAAAVRELGRAKAVEHHARRSGTEARSPTKAESKRMREAIEPEQQELDVRRAQETLPQVVVRSV